MSQPADEGYKTLGLSRYPDRLLTWYKQAVAAILCLLLGVAAWFGWQVHIAIDTASVGAIELPDDIELCSGDIILAGGVSLQSRLVLQITHDNHYSHVGMIEAATDGLYVIHVAPHGAGDGGVGGRAGRIPIKLFLSDRGYVAVCVIRLRSEADTAGLVAKSATDNAIACVEQAIPFDNGFNLSDPQAMYCSELVYRAYQQACYNWPDSLIRNVSTLVVKGPVITPDAFTECSDFKTIWKH